MNIIFKMRLFFVFLMMFFASGTYAANAMLTWVSEPEVGETQINVQVMLDDVWLSVEPIYQTRERNFSPTIASNQQSNILVAWSATSTVRSMLRAVFYRDNKWQPVEILANQGGETTTPAIIFDRNDNAVIAWVSDHKGLDDVYIRRWNRINNQWSSLEQVNSDNNVPDIQPSLSLDQQGNVVVYWRSVDKESQVYVDRSRVYQVDKTTPLIVSDKHRELSASDIKMPENWQGSIGQAVMHFPDNSQIRQEKLAIFR